MEEGGQGEADSEQAGAGHRCALVQGSVRRRCVASPLAQDRQRGASRQGLPHVSQRGRWGGLVGMLG